MEIKSTSNPDPRPDAGKAVTASETGSRVAGRGAAAAQISAPTADKLTLTETAHRLREAAGAGGESPVDRTKVAELRQAIAEGSYTVDSGRIARKLIAFDNR